MGKLRKLLIAIPIVFGSGCLVPYWVSPAVDYVPTAHISESVEAVHAFRVDTRKSTVYVPGPLCETHQLAEIPIGDDGKIPAQLSFSCTRGFFAFFVALNYLTWHQDALSIRLYRAGFETIELKPSVQASDMHWKPACTLAEQCKAIDDLVAGNLEAGGISKDHHAALLFAATEYRQLATFANAQDPQTLSERQQIMKKAEDLEKRAAVSYERGWVEQIID